MTERKLNQSSQFDKPSWDWTPVECILKTTENNRKSVQWQLAPSILLTNPTSSSSDPNVRLFIDTEKSLSYAPDLGWNWHKSWNLPNISIRLQIKDEVTGEQLLTPKNIYAQIFAVKKNGDNDRSEKVTLLDVGIRGENKMQMIDGQVYFSAMKFSSTTYNNQGQNFHLLIVIYIQQNQCEKPKVLTAVISPEIFVDSRRSARDYHQKKFNSFVQPFSTDQLEKQFIKRQNKSRTEQQIQIKNDPQGFYNYLTAPNIRHKVKHPIFLAIRFSNCVTILYNEEKIAEVAGIERQNLNLNAKEVIEMLQKKLLKQSQTKNVRQETQTDSLQDKLYLFVVRNVSDSLKRKKVMQSIQTLQSQSFSVVQDQKQIPSGFKKFTDLGSLSKIYKDNFELLRQLCRKYVPSDEQSISQQSDQQYGGEEQYKKVKVNKIQNGNGYTFLNNPASNRRSKAANIVCQTIQTHDNKPGHESKAQKKASEISNSNKFHEKQKQREIKKQQIYGKDYYQQSPQQGPSSNTNLNLNILQKPNTSFSMNIGSKKGAFNNLRTPEQQKQPESFNQNQYNPNNPISAGFTGFTPNAANSFGLGNLGALGGLNGLGGFGANGLGQSMTGMPNMANLNGLNSMSSLGSLGMGMPGMPNMGGLSGMQGLQNLQGLQGMQGMQGLQGGLQGLQGLQGMQGMAAMNNLNSMTGMTNPSALSGLNSLSNLNLPLFQGLSPNALNSMMGNGSGGNFNNFPANNPSNLNINNQAKSLQNLLCSNLLLSNWLNSVKSNNVNLYESVKGAKLNDDQMKPTDTKNIQDALGDLGRMSPQLQQQQSMVCLLQQINLYRELLAQVTYQNQLLGSNVNSNQGGLSTMEGISELQNLMQSDKNMNLRGFQQSKDSEPRQPKQQHRQ